MVNVFVSRMEDPFDVTHLDVMKILDVQRLLLSQRRKEREGCSDRMIHVSFIKKSPTVDEIMKTDRERIETAQE